MTAVMRKIRVILNAIPRATLAGRGTACRAGGIRRLALLAVVERDLSEFAEVQLPRGFDRD